VWDERAFFNGYSHTKTVSEVAHRKTERLADAAAQRRKGSYERRERLDAVPPDSGDRVDRIAPFGPAAAGAWETDDVRERHGRRVPGCGDVCRA